MPTLDEIREFAKKLGSYLGYEYLAEDYPSRVSLLANQQSKFYEEVKQRVLSSSSG